MNDPLLKLRQRITAIFFETIQVKQIGDETLAALGIKKNRMNGLRLGHFEPTASEWVSFCEYAGIELGTEACPLKTQGYLSAMRSLQKKAEIAKKRVS